MDQNATKHILEAALLATDFSVSLDKLTELFTMRGVDVDRASLRDALNALAADYADRQLELKETASGFRIQIRSSAREWLQPLFEERAPRYTRALLETLALIAYRQPITRAEIEEVRGVAVSSNIIRTLLERGWVRVVGFRDVPGKPSMLGTTKEFLDYFGLKRLDDLPPLAELRELSPEADPQPDFVDELAAVLRSEEQALDESVSMEAESAANVVPIHQSEA
jgi:segregation and condensation protein B